MKKQKIIAFALLAVVLCGGVLGQLQVFADDGNTATGGIIGTVDGEATPQSGSGEDEIGSVDGEATPQSGSGENNSTQAGIDDVSGEASSGAGNNNDSTQDKNSYGIVYSGGELLDEVVIEDKNLVDNLIQAISKEGTIIKSSSNKWDMGYIRHDGVCVKRPYFVYEKGGSLNDLYFDMVQGDYRARVQFTNVEIEDMTLSGSQKVAIVLDDDTGMIRGGYSVWVEKIDCEGEDRASKVYAKGLGTSKDGAVFIEVESKLYKGNDLFISDEMYFGIDDIDAGQSYQIRNQDNFMRKNSNMYVKNKASLQKSDNTLKNRFNSNSDGIFNYIYSDESTVTGGTLDIESGNDVFIPITTSVQQGGLKMVFGFTQAAGSRVEYYVPVPKKQEEPKDETAKTPNTGLFTSDGNNAKLIIGIIIPAIIILGMVVTTLYDRKKHQVKFNK